MDVIQERDASNNVITKYTRAGNIGGLLSKSVTSNGWSTRYDYFYHYDGSGNVTQMTDVSQSVVAEYAYDAYGNTTRIAGTQAAANLHRFSTKEFHLQSGLYDYGFRFYSPSLGRWINRDPIEEDGGMNLYAMVGNSPTNASDSYGLMWQPGMGPPTKREYCEYLAWQIDTTRDELRKRFDDLRGR